VPWLGHLRVTVCSNSDIRCYTAMNVFLKCVPYKLIFFFERSIIKLPCSVPTMLIVIIYYFDCLCTFLCVFNCLSDSRSGTINVFQVWYVSKFRISGIFISYYPDGTRISLRCPRDISFHLLICKRYLVETFWDLKIYLRHLVNVPETKMSKEI